MKKYKVELTQAQISFIEHAMDAIVSDRDYGSPLYRADSKLEQSVKKEFRTAMRPITEEDLKDIRRTLRTPK